MSHIFINGSVNFSGRLEDVNCMCLQYHYWAKSKNISFKYSGSSINGHFYTTVPLQSMLATQKMSRTKILRRTLNVRFNLATTNRNSSLTLSRDLFFVKATYSADTSLHFEARCNQVIQSWWSVLCSVVSSLNLETIFFFYIYIYV